MKGRKAIKAYFDSEKKSTKGGVSKLLINTCIYSIFIFILLAGDDTCFVLL
jgi:hypothetical protein